MSGKIEKGCLAIIINSSFGNNGICVTVGNPFLPEIWYIDKELKGIPPANVIPEYQLMRIDDFEDLKKYDAEQKMNRPKLSEKRKELIS